MIVMTTIIAMTNTIAMIAKNTTVVFVTSYCISMATVAIMMTSIAANPRKMTIAIASEKQSIISCTMTVAPGALVLSLAITPTLSVMAHCWGSGPCPLPGPWKTSTLRTREMQVLARSRRPILTLMMTMITTVTRFRRAIVFMLPLIFATLTNKKAKKARHKTA